MLRLCKRRYARECPEIKRMKFQAKKGESGTCQTLFKLDHAKYEDLSGNQTPTRVNIEFLEFGAEIAPATRRSSRTMTSLLGSSGTSSATTASTSTLKLNKRELLCHKAQNALIRALARVESIHKLGGNSSEHCAQFDMWLLGGHTQIQPAYIGHNARLADSKHVR